MTPTISIILGHGKVAPAVERLLPVVRRLGHPVFVCCPIQDPIPGALRLWTRSERGGEGGVERMRELMGFLYRKFTDAIVFEYDAVCLKSSHDSFNGLCGIRGKYPDSKFISPEYVLSPWTIDSHSVAKMCDAIDKNLGVKEFGEADRLLSAWAFLAGVPITPHPEPSFAENTIESFDLPNVPKDAKWIHGIKSEEVFNALVTHGNNPSI